MLQTQQQRRLLMEKLNRCLEKFQATKIADITAVYEYYPTFAQAKLGEGSYGAAYRMRSINAQQQQQLVVAKVIPKDRITSHLLQIHHLCAELAVTRILDHENLNRRVGLYHNETTIFMVLELVEGKTPDLATRLYHIFANYAKHRIPEVAQLVADTPPGGEDLTVANALRSTGVQKEAPLATDLFNAIVHAKRIPAKKSLVITKQILAGLSYMHLNQVVHRDMKTENLVLGEDRKATPIYDDDGKTVKGVRIEERLRCRIIDFGLVKYMKLSQFPSSPSPGVFLKASAAQDDPFSSAKPLGELSTSAGQYVPPPQSCIPVTPCGTELYCSLEVIQGILSGGCGRVKWESTMDNLPKFDVYGAGTMLFCMCNGRPPFRHTAYRQVTREEKLRQMAVMIAAGPQFSPGCAEFIRPLIRLLMSNNVAQRPSAEEALKMDIFKNITDTYTYDVMVNGEVIVHDYPVPPLAAVAAAPAATEALPAAAPVPAVADSATSAPPEEAEDDSFQEGDAEAYRDTLAVVRGAEDNGDAADKEDADKAGEAPAGTTTTTTTTTAAAEAA